MKRLIFVLLLSAMLLNSSCQQPAQNDNRLANSNTNTSPPADESTGTISFIDFDQDDCRAPGPADQMPVLITLSKVSGACKIVGVYPEEVALMVRRHWIKWCVKNDCDETVEVFADNFRVENSPAEQNPLGTSGPLSNHFYMGPIKKGRSGFAVSDPASKYYATAYKYDVKVYDTRTHRLLDIQDPHVVISGTLDPGLKQPPNKNNNNK